MRVDRNNMRWSLSGRILFLMILVFMGLTSCIQVFDYKPKDSGERMLVVDGRITSQAEKQYIRLSRSAPYGTGDYYPEPGATVHILENGKIVDTCFEISEDTYQINADKIKPRPGNDYAVEIILLNGKTYRSEPEIMPEPVKPDTAYSKTEIESIPSASGTYVSQTSVNVYVDTPVRKNGKPALLRWRVAQEYSFTEPKYSPLVIPKTCYMNLGTDNQDVNIYDGSEVSGGILKGQLIFTRNPKPNYEFSFIHFFRISQYSLTKKAFEYWSKLKQIANPVGSFLDPPPAAVIGNIHNVNDPEEIVLGYFSAAGQEYINTFTNAASLLPYYVPYPCSGEFPPYCYNCLSLPNSSLDRPPYWP